jgi:hypothetical protein
MFDSWKNLVFFLVGLGMTIGLLLTPHLVPGGWGYQIGLAWPAQLVVLVLAAKGIILAATLWLAGRMIHQAKTWKEPRVIGATIMIMLVANFLYMFLIEWFDLHSGYRALIAVIGVPIIYGNLGRVLGKQPLKTVMLNLFSGALITMGAGFIIVAIIRNW